MHFDRSSCGEVAPGVGPFHRRNCLRDLCDLLRNFGKSFLPDEARIMRVSNFCENDSSSSFVSGAKDAAPGKALPFGHPASVWGRILRRDPLRRVQR